MKKYEALDLEINAVHLFSFFFGFVGARGAFLHYNTKKDAPQDRFCLRQGRFSIKKAERSSTSDTTPPKTVYAKGAALSSPKKTLP